MSIYTLPIRKEPEERAGKPAPTRMEELNLYNFIKIKLKYVLYFRTKLLCSFRAPRSMKILDFSLLVTTPTES